MLSRWLLVQGVNVPPWDSWVDFAGTRGALSGASWGPGNPHVLWPWFPQKAGGSMYTSPPRLTGSGKPRAAAPAAPPAGFRGLGTGLRNFLPSQVLGVARGCGPTGHSSHSVTWSRPLLSCWTVTTSSLCSQSLSLSFSGSLSLSFSGIDLKFPSVPLSSWLCFIPLEILFTTILMASQEEEKRNGHHQSAMFFVKGLSNVFKIGS